MADKRIGIAITVDGQQYKAELDRLANKTQQLGKSGKRTAADISHLNGVLKLGSGLLAAFSLTELATSFIQITAESQKMAASLETVLGSADKAQQAMDYLQAFATRTPYQLEQVTSAYIKLNAFGLEASERAMVSYGDTASAMGRDLDQMIEAVADAATGEFERLKEFGIKSKNQGDTISFTFKGITTSVANNSAAIQEYLMALGENNFAGAMEKQMGTLGGAISNMKDSYSRMVLAMSEAGADALLQDLVRGISELMDTITLFVNNPASMPEWLKGLSRSLLYAQHMLNSVIVEFKYLGEIIDAFKGDHTIATLRLINAEVAAEKAGSALALAEALEKLDKVNDEIAKKKPKPTLPDAPNPSGDKTGTNTSGTGASSQPKRDHGKELIAQLQRQVVLYNEVSLAAEARYDIEHGKLASLTPAQQQQIVQLSEQLDLLEQRKKAEDAAKQAAEQAQKALEQEAKRLTQLYADPQEQIYANIERFDALLNKGLITWDVYTEAVMDAHDELDALAETGSAVMDIFTEAGDGIAGALADAAISGKNSFDDLFESALKQLVALQIQAALINPLMGKTASNPLMEFFTSLTGERANGGQLQPGGRYLVGERGPELLTMTGAGHITPNHALGGDVQVNVYNQGKPMQATASPPRMDGQKAVIDIVLADIENGGRLDNALAQRGAGRRF